MSTDSIATSNVAGLGSNPSVPARIIMDKVKRSKRLVDISNQEAQLIIENIQRNPSLYLWDYGRLLDLPVGFLQDISREQNSQIPQKRRDAMDAYKRSILSLRTVDQKLSLLRMNPLTNFENHPPIFFGIGGGSRNLCKALPFDVLGMVLTAEKLKRDLQLSECRVLFANRITYTNISKSPEFSKKSIDRVLIGERDLLQFVIKKLGFRDWRLFLDSDVEKIFEPKSVNLFEEIIRNADQTHLVGGHHYAIEMAEMWLLAGEGHGGVKLGWFINNEDKVNGGYIMDEQPFDARYALFMAKQNISNTITLAYANAGAKLNPGRGGALDKAPPYICYEPDERLLLSPFEKVYEKLERASLSGGGMRFKYYRKLMSGITDLFEELVLGADSGKTIKRIMVSVPNDFPHSRLCRKIEFIQHYLFNGEKEAEKIWTATFPHVV
ncbi:MAG: hypothetical protein US18_C0022G0005 [Parcubacteria group bacterium GW2011_GWB1_36_5]|uniref:Uncharacterized protein n=1 Tax=Candidatus Curtissbacteria bacterium GW2011_GWC2_38_9 TaxID=1618414 RepID=A0A0G0LE90_9BACT|nr:MAG: hypothetical protein US18_C0022G0005 [Parcubacteria group bacterium GW2011_GWB1_36_5]KKQ89372.1 MAG: hypothetical protein UT12_C0015G0003 [Candidatus Curtissbacteria bacterium GW2011_GWC2_38_9]